mmetsp:Transcript_86503/g.244425  ORF Transcript_86503/g.244425 Transcript_86503/m.244425 type:complete len:167 (+) Transcript_86503:677-1177(+)
MFVTSSEGSVCSHLLDKLSCAPCSPTAKWYTEDFNIGSYDYPSGGGYGVNRTEYIQPVRLCEFYARSIYDECKDCPLTSMAGSKYADGKTTLQEAYPEYDDDVIPKVFGVADTADQVGSGANCLTCDLSKPTYQPRTHPMIPRRSLGCIASLQLGRWRCGSGFGAC